MDKSPSIKELAAALSKSQGEFPPIPKSRSADVALKSGGRYKYKYADLADIIGAITPTLAKNGISVSQQIATDIEGMYLETTLMHTSGEWITGRYPLSKRERPQEMGSEITYARRYTLTSALGIHADEDDDGVAAMAARERKNKAVNKKVSKKTDAVPEYENHGLGLESSEPAMPEPGDYVLRVGRDLKGRRLIDVGTARLKNLVKWADDQASTGKTLHPEVVEDIHEVRLYLDFIERVEDQSA
jgi:hypothetical protein